MKGKLLRTHLSALVFGAALAAPAGAQQTSTEDLRKDIESIRETLRVIQKDIQEIKESLARSAPASSESRQGRAERQADARRVFRLSVTVLRQVRP